MSDILAICPNCGPFITQQLIELGPGARVEIINSRVSCPNCGQLAPIPDGLYQAMGNTMKVLLTSGRSLQQLEALRRALKTAAQQNASREEVGDAIVAHAPELKSLADILPKTRIELFAFVTAIIAILTLLKTFCGAPTKVPKTDAEIQVIVEQTVAKAIAEKSTDQLQPMNRAQRRAGGRPLRPAKHK